MHSIRVFAIGVVFGLFATAAAAQQYPTHNVSLLVPFAPGPTDTVARVVALSMQKQLGQTITVENRPSAGGILAPEVTKNAKPDGYTILIHHIGMATIPALYRQLRFNPLTDFEYIGLINEVPMTLIGTQKLPPNNFKELIAYIKQNKEKVNFANAGIGAASHLCGLLFMKAIEVDMTTIPYKGTGPAIQDLLGGQVQLLCDQTTNTTSQINAHKVKVYGVTSAKRVDSLKDVPTLQEQGLKGFEITIWHGLYAPKGTPKPIMDKLSAALAAALKDPAVIGRFSELGATTYPPEKATAAALQAHLKSETEKWGPVIRAAGQYAD